MAPEWEALQQHASALGLTLSSDQIEQLRIYARLLGEWNERFNLTAIRDPAEVVEKHFLDSLTPAILPEVASARRLVDVGTGAGFPGLVLKIAFPALEVVLLDALAKRLRFLERVSQELSLEGVHTLHARAEDAAALRPVAKPAIPCRERFDVAIARAVARLDVVAEWLLPLVRVGGAAVAMKGPDIAGEVDLAAGAIATLGGGEPRVVPLVLPGTSTGRSLVVMNKERPCPARYPRQPGTARRHPLSGTPLESQVGTGGETPPAVQLLQRKSEDRSLDGPV